MGNQTTKSLPELYLSNELTFKTLLLQLNQNISINQRICDKTDEKGNLIHVNPQKGEKNDKNDKKRPDPSLPPSITASTDLKNLTRQQYLMMNDTITIIAAKRGDLSRLANFLVLGGSATYATTASRNALLWALAKQHDICALYLYTSYFELRSMQFLPQMIQLATVKHLYAMVWFIVTQRHAFKKPPMVDMSPREKGGNDFGSNDSNNNNNNNNNLHNDTNLNNLLNNTHPQHHQHSIYPQHSPHDPTAIFSFFDKDTPERFALDRLMASVYHSNMVINSTTAQGPYLEEINQRGQIGADLSTFKNGEKNDFLKRDAKSEKYKNEKNHQNAIPNPSLSPQELFILTTFLNVLHHCVNHYQRTPLEFASLGLPSSVSSMEIALKTNEKDQKRSKNDQNGTKYDKNYNTVVQFTDETLASRGTNATLRYNDGNAQNIRENDENKDENDENRESDENLLHPSLSFLSSSPLPSFKAPKWRLPLYWLSLYDFIDQVVRGEEDAITNQETNTPQSQLSQQYIPNQPSPNNSTNVSIQPLSPSFRASLPPLSPSSPSLRALRPPFGPLSPSDNDPNTSLSANSAVKNGKNTSNASGDVDYANNPVLDHDTPLNLPHPLLLTHALINTRLCAQHLEYGQFDQRNDPFLIPNGQNRTSFDKNGKNGSSFDKNDPLSFNSQSNSSVSATLRSASLEPKGFFYCTCGIKHNNDNNNNNNNLNATNNPNNPSDNPIAQSRAYCFFYPPRLSVPTVPVAYRGVLLPSFSLNKAIVQSQDNLHSEQYSHHCNQQRRLLQSSSEVYDAIVEGMGLEGLRREREHEKGLGDDSKNERGKDNIKNNKNNNNNKNVQKNNCNIKEELSNINFPFRFNGGNTDELYNSSQFDDQSKQSSCFDQRNTQKSSFGHQNTQTSSFLAQKAELSQLSSLLHQISTPTSGVVGVSQDTLAVTSLPHTRILSKSVEYINNNTSNSLTHHNFLTPTHNNHYPPSQHLQNNTLDDYLSYIGMFSGLKETDCNRDSLVQTIAPLYAEKSDQNVQNGQNYRKIPQSGQNSKKPTYLSYINDKNKRLIYSGSVHCVDQCYGYQESVQNYDNYQQSVQNNQKTVQNNPKSVQKYQNNNQITHNCSKNRTKDHIITTEYCYTSLSLDGDGLLIHSNSDGDVNNNNDDNTHFVHFDTSFGHFDHSNTNFCNYSNNNNFSNNLNNHSLHYLDNNITMFSSFGPLNLSDASIHDQYDDSSHHLIDNTNNTNYQVSNQPQQGHNNNYSHHHQDSNSRQNFPNSHQNFQTSHQNFPPQIPQQTTLISPSPDPLSHHHALKLPHNPLALNYPQLYWTHHKSFFDDFLKKKLPFCPLTTILYHPSPLSLLANTNTPFSYGIYALHTVFHHQPPRRYVGLRVGENNSNGMIGFDPNQVGADDTNRTTKNDKKDSKNDKNDKNNKKDGNNNTSSTPSSSSPPASYLYSKSMSSHSSVLEELYENEVYCEVEKSFLKHSLMIHGSLYNVTNDNDLGHISISSPYYHSKKTKKIKYNKDINKGSGGIATMPVCYEENNENSLQNDQISSQKNKSIETSPQKVQNCSKPSKKVHQAVEISPHPSLSLTTTSIPVQNPSIIYMVASLHRLLVLKYPHMMLLYEWYHLTTKMANFLPLITQLRVNTWLLGTEIPLLQAFKSRLVRKRALVEELLERCGDGSTGYNDSTVDNTNQTSFQTSDMNNLDLDDFFQDNDQSGQSGPNPNQLGQNYHPNSENGINFDDFLGPDDDQKEPQTVQHDDGLEFDCFILPSPQQSCSSSTSSSSSSSAVISSITQHGASSSSVIITPPQLGSSSSIDREFTPQQFSSSSSSTSTIQQLSSSSSSPCPSPQPPILKTNLLYLDDYITGLDEYIATRQNHLKNYLNFSFFHSNSLLSSLLSNIAPLSTFDATLFQIPNDSTMGTSIPDPEDQLGYTKTSHTANFDPFGANSANSANPSTKTTKTTPISSISSLVSGQSNVNNARMPNNPRIVPLVMTPQWCEAVLTNKYVKNGEENQMMLSSWKHIRDLTLEVIDAETQRNEEIVQENWRNGLKMVKHDYGDVLGPTSNFHFANDLFQVGNDISHGNNLGSFGTATPSSSHQFNITTSNSLNNLSGAGIALSGNFDENNNKANFYIDGAQEKIYQDEKLAQMEKFYQDQMVNYHYPHFKLLKAFHDCFLSYIITSINRFIAKVTKLAEDIKDYLVSPSGYVKKYTLSDVPLAKRTQNQQNSQHSPNFQNATPSPFFFAHLPHLIPPDLQSLEVSLEILTKLLQEAIDIRGWLVMTSPYDQTTAQQIDFKLICERFLVDNDGAECEKYREYKNHENGNYENYENHKDCSFNGKHHHNHQSNRANDPNVKTETDCVEMLYFHQNLFSQGHFYPTEHISVINSIEKTYNSIKNTAITKDTPQQPQIALRKKHLDSHFSKKSPQNSDPNHSFEASLSTLILFASPSQHASSDTSLLESGAGTMMSSMGSIGSVSSQEDGPFGSSQSFDPLSDLTPSLKKTISHTITTPGYLINKIPPQQLQQITPEVLERYLRDEYERLQQYRVAHIDPTFTSLFFNPKIFLQNAQNGSNLQNSQNSSNQGPNQANLGQNSALVTPLSLVPDTSYFPKQISKQFLVDNLFSGPIRCYLMGLSATETTKMGLLECLGPKVDTFEPFGPENAVLNQRSSILPGLGCGNNHINDNVMKYNNNNNNNCNNDGLLIHQPNNCNNDGLLIHKLKVPSGFLKKSDILNKTLSNEYQQQLANSQRRDNWQGNAPNPQRNDKTDKNNKNDQNDEKGNKNTQNNEKGDKNSPNSASNQSQPPYFQSAFSESGEWGYLGSGEGVFVPLNAICHQPEQMIELIDQALTLERVNSQQRVEMMVRNGGNRGRDNNNNSNNFNNNNNGNNNNNNNNIGLYPETPSFRTPISSLTPLTPSMSRTLSQYNNTDSNNAIKMNNNNDNSIKNQPPPPQPEKKEKRGFFASISSKFSSKPASAAPTPPPQQQLSTTLSGPGYNGIGSVNDGDGMGRERLFDNNQHSTPRTPTTPTTPTTPGNMGYGMGGNIPLSPGSVGNGNNCNNYANNCNNNNTTALSPSLSRYSGSSFNNNIGNNSVNGGFTSAVQPDFPFDCSFMMDQTISFLPNHQNHHNIASIRDGTSNHVNKINNTVGNSTGDNNNNSSTTHTPPATSSTTTTTLPKARSSQIQQYQWQQQQQQQYQDGHQQFQPQQLQPLSMFDTTTTVPPPPALDIASTPRAQHLVASTPQYTQSTLSQQAILSTPSQQIQKYRYQFLPTPTHSSQFLTPFHSNNNNVGFQSPLEENDMGRDNNNTPSHLLPHPHSSSSPNFTTPLSVAPAATPTHFHFGLAPSCFAKEPDVDLTMDPFGPTGASLVEKESLGTENDDVFNAVMEQVEILRGSVERK